MRRYIFGWMAVALVVASAAGCGGNGGDASNYVVPDIPPVSDSQRTVSYLVEDFQKGDDCHLVISTNAKTAENRDLRKVTVSSDVDYSVSSSPKQFLAKDDEAEAYAPMACGFAEAAIDISTAEETATEGSARINHGASASFDSMKKGDVEWIWAAFNGTAQKVYVKKVLDSDPTTHCNILSSATKDETGNYATELTEAQALAVAQAFDNEIYDQVTKVCGYEWNTGGGRDGDRRVNIVFLRDEQMKKQDGSTIYGFVSVRDLLPRVSDEYSAKVEKNYSNGGEYIYLNYDVFFGGATDAALGGEEFKTALAHEFTHLTQLNQKVAKNGFFTDLGQVNAYSSVAALYSAVGDPTLTEGLAEVGADLCGFGVNYADGKTSGKAASQLSLDSIYRYMNGKSTFATEDSKDAPTIFPTAFFDTEAKDLAGMGHLFGLHILGYYGKDTLSKLYKSPDCGVELLEGALGEPVNDIMHRYDMAVSLSGLGSLPTQYAKYEIPYVNLGGSNVYLASDGSIKSVNINKAVDADYRIVYPKLSASQFEVLPWFNCLTHLVCQTSAPLKVNAVVPKSAQTNLIHIDDNGDIKAIY